MRKLYLPLLILCTFLSLGFTAFATEEDKPTKPKTAGTGTSTVTEDPPTQSEINEQKQLYKKASLEAQLELNKAMQGINMSVEKIIQKDYMMDVTARTNAVIADARSQAKGVFDYLDSKGLYKEGDLQYEDLMTLPIGLKKKLGNSTVEVGILKASFYSDYAEMTVFVRMKIAVPASSGSTEREIFFGVDKIKFSKAGGIQAFNAVLLGDFIIPMGKWTLKLKGGLDIATGNIDYTDATYCSVVCGQFNDAQLSAEIIFPRDVLIPLNPTDYVISTNSTERVTGKFKVRVYKGLNDITAAADIDKPFSVAGFEAVGFELKRVILDLSDQDNAGIVFPSGYDLTKFRLNNPGSNTNNDNSWKGLYIGQFKLILPSEFKDKTVTHASGRKTIDVTDFLFDQSGVTGSFGITGTAANPVIATKNGSASSWGFALYNFRVDLLQNKLTGGEFAGDVRIPLAPKDKFEYNGVFLTNGDFTATVAAKGSYTMNFDAFRAKATIINPVLKLDRVGGAFRPYAKLNGKLTIATNTGGTSDENNDPDNAPISLKEIVFQNLELQTVSPYVRMDPVELKDNKQRLVGFPVALNSFGISQTDPDKAKVGLEMSISLMADKLSGAAGGDFNMNYVQNGAEGGAEWQFESFTLRKIRVDGQIGSAVSLKGEVEMYNTAQKKGFRGQIGVKIEGGTLKIDAGACAEFGYQKTENYHYWNVQIAARFDPSLPLAGPFAINGASLGVYHHMKADYTQGGRASVCALGSQTVQYTEDKSISLGVKGVLGLEAGGKLAFNGFAGLEFVIGKEYGLQYINLFGEGTIAGGFKLPGGVAGAVDYMGEQYGKVLEKATELSTDISQATKGLGTMTPDMIDKKAKEQFPGIKQSNLGGTLNGAVYAKVGFELNLEPSKEFFRARAEVQVNAAGIITGSGKLEVFIGHNPDKAGNPNEWWVYAGTTKDRLKLGVDLGFAEAGASGYFMLGYNIPDLPCPTGFVYETFKDKLNCTNGSYQRACATQDKNDFENTGTGIAFGLEAHISGGFNVGLYGKAWAQAGFDVNIKEYSGRPFCGRGTGENDLGIKRWYAIGQVYAGLHVEVGLKIFGAEIELASGTAAAVLQVGLPKPTWFRGLLKLELSVLGLIDASVEPDIQIGDVCPEIAGSQVCNQ
jgi:hypothetical protein